MHFFWSPVAPGETVEQAIRRVWKDRGLPPEFFTLEMPALDFQNLVGLADSGRIDRDALRAMAEAIFTRTNRRTT